MFLIVQQILPIVFSLVFLGIIGLINVKLAKKRYSYAYIIPGIFTIIGVLLIIYAYLVSGGWDALAYLLFGMIALTAGIVSAIVSFGIVFFLKKPAAKKGASKQEKTDDLQKLTKLNRLYREGEITEEEFEKERAKLLQ